MPPKDSNLLADILSMSSRARELRTNQTPAEYRLWTRLSNRQLLGYKFRRQHIVGPYILDFYCPGAHLAVELDGDQHANAATLAYDQQRSRFLFTRGIRVIRFWNYEILDELESVLEQISAALGE
ncbi:MAG: endonuclease domain-containing protein [Anaerolineae bacterium]